MKLDRITMLPLFWSLVLTMVLTVSACTRSEPIVIDQAALTSRETLKLRTGERVTIAGYSSDVIAVEDADVLQLVTDAQDITESDPLETTVETTYEAMRAGQTEVVVTHSMCEGITGCSGPALYYRLQVHVR